MQIVIDVPEEVFNEIVSADDTSHLSRAFLKGSYLYFKEALQNGTPLPKGHGDLKDFEKIYADMSEREELARQRVIDTPSSSPCYMRYVAQLNERTAFKEMLFDAPTIIEADKGVEE